MYFDSDLKGKFTIQAEPINQFVDSWERFVRIKSGEYFFFPSMSVLNYLATLWSVRLRRMDSQY
jgi:hypothetical protein